MATALFSQLERRTGRLVLAVLVVTAALVVPFLTMTPDESASTEPGGAVFDARDRIDERFVSSVFFTGVIGEAEGGDVLLAEPLLELQQAQDALRNDPEIGPKLFTYFDVESTTQVQGVVSLADFVDAELRTQGIDGLAGATDTEVKAAGAAVIDRFGTDSTLLGISVQSTQNAAGEWIVPAVQLSVLSDDSQLGFGNVSVNLGSDTAPEEYSRDILAVLRGADGWTLNGIAIDVNLTSEEQGAVAGPFIGFTVLAALLLVGLTFRSYWVLAVVSASFLVLLIWLKGVSNLIGFKDDLILSLIVPIAMISFGVDYAFHAIGRYREERADGKSAAPAVAAGAAAVSGALVLATVSDSVAFLANVTAGIESVVQFGIGAAIALFSAFLLLGVVAPYVIAAIEARVPAPPSGRRATALRILGAVGAAMLAMAAVLMLVFLLPWLGVLLTVVSIVSTLVVPFMVRSRRLADSDAPAVGDLPIAGGEGRLAERVGAVVAAIAARRAVVLPAAVLVTAVAAVFAVQVPARFDVEDFFSADTDFVQGLDMLDVHVGEREGEPASIYIEGDLTDPASLAAVSARIDELRNSDSEFLARVDGEVRLFDYGIFEVFDETWASPLMVDLVAQQTGVALTDIDGDTIPDTREQIVALVGVASEIGIPFDAEQLAMTPDDVAVRVSFADAAIGFDSDATLVSVGLINSRDQSAVRDARDALTETAEAISADLGGTFVEATGSPLVREGSLEGTNRALLVSLPIAVLACLAVASTFLRSIRYGLASVVPILMVVAWLYAFMEIAGYSINLVTATIAAVSIGIGIDFALHYISRYREELERWGQRSVAVRIAGEGTGLALVASAISSAVGFGILAFAPMPLFAAYGLLTATMIVMALVATLAVLPSILVLITCDAASALDPDDLDPTIDLMATAGTPAGA
ncbi:MAG: MMPL family transporter [Actinomycetota bacterium]